jgi:hypothetical protein
MELSDTACALGLYRYNCDKPNSTLFQLFHAAIVSAFQSYGIDCTYFGADGPGYPDKLTKIGGRAYARAVKSGFADLAGVEFMANPLDSDAPAYDSFAIGRLDYFEVNRELVACLAINESFLQLHTKEYVALLRSQAQLCQWDYGFGFSSSVDKEPDYHILGLDNGKLSPEEFESLNAWYAAPPEVRAASLRDVYPYNLLNETQLSARVGGDMTLHQFAQDEPGCSLTRLTDYGLYLWQVPDAEVDRLRKALRKSGVLVASQRDSAARSNRW